LSVVSVVARWFERHRVWNPQWPRDVLRARESGNVIVPSAGVKVLVATLPPAAQYHRRPSGAGDSTALHKIRPSTAASRCHEDSEGRPS